MTLFDTSVVLDLLYPQSPWYGWSANEFTLRLASGEPLLISHIVFAELHAVSDTAERERGLARLDFQIDPLDEVIARRAGRAHNEYRQRGGGRSTIIADFLIGAHAAVRGIPLVTRDRRRVAGYFPELSLISPTETE